MDKLRALQYFVAAAQERSLTGAARELGVTVPAVSKLVNALEKQLGAALFVRSPQGLALTNDGERYYASLQPLLEQMAEADQALSLARERPRGLLTVGGTGFILQNCLAPALPRFHARYPDVEVELRTVNRVDDGDAAGSEVFILIGWHETPDFVQRHLAFTRYLVLASPGYWLAHGMPHRPNDLYGHQCLSFRNPHGTMLDLWEFERQGEKESVRVRGWLSSDHRNLLVDAAIAGEGVLRAADLPAQRYVQLGRLTPALSDWNALHAPPIIALFRPRHRRTPRVRVFLEFAAETFRRLEAERDGTVHAPQRPEWYWTQQGRASIAARPNR